MADPFSIATGAVSIIGLGGQVAQGVSFLYSIFKDVKDFPKSLRDFVSNLELLRNILERLEANKLPPPNGKEDVVMKAYQQCGERVRLLEKVLINHEIKPNYRRAKRKWKQIMGGLDINDIEKHAKRIEEAKSSLQTTLKIELQVFHRTYTTRVEGMLDSISLDISNLAQGTGKLYTSIEEMKEAIASLEREFRLSKPPAVVGPNTDVQPADPSPATPALMEVNESQPQCEGDSISNERDGNGDDDSSDNDVRYNNHDCGILEDPDRGKTSTDECLSTSLLARDFPIDRRVPGSSSSLYILLGTLEWKTTTTTINWKDSSKGGEHGQRPWKVTARSLKNFRPAP